MEGFLIFLGIAAVLAVWYFIAKEFRRIAAMKGHDEERYFWWTFLFGPVGMMMVIALPAGAAVPEKDVYDDEIPEI